MDTGQDVPEWGAESRVSLGRVTGLGAESTVQPSQKSVSWSSRFSHPQQSEFTLNWRSIRWTQLTVLRRSGDGVKGPGRATCPSQG